MKNTITAKNTVTALVLSVLLGSSAMAGTEHPQGKNHENKHGHNHGNNHGNNHGHGHGHGHTETPASQETVEKNAASAIASLIERGKLDKSWATIKLSTATQQIFNTKPEWVVVYTNPHITHTDKQTLYVFLTLGGQYIAANHTGH